jgi:hypothetical protein
MGTWTLQLDTNDDGAEIYLHQNVYELVEALEGICQEVKRRLESDSVITDAEEAVLQHIDFLARNARGVI